VIVSIKEKRNPKTRKPITVVEGITHNPQVIEDLSKKLKNSCGAGGHIEGKTIIIQGSHIKKIASILNKEGYSIK
jgi:translation initiation factor 1 (eIF-1/SUI1)